MRVLAFGEVMMRLMAPDHKTLEQTHSFETLFTGTGVNILGGLHQLGVQTRLFTCLPDNRLGKSALASMRHLGIETDFIHQDLDHMGMYFLEKGFGARSSYVTYMDRSQTSFAKHSYSKTNYEALLADVDCVHICGISLIQDTTYEVALELAMQARQRAITVVFDCNYRPSLWVDPEASLERYHQILNLADYGFATVRDAYRLLENSAHLDEASVMDAFIDRYLLKGVFGTKRLGLDEIQGLAYVKQQCTKSRVYPLEVYDRVGGGDGFALGVIYGLLQAYDTEYLVEFACASGVLAHTSYGDTPVVSKQDIVNLVDGIHHDIVR